jgi:hypothetical protein
MIHIPYIAHIPFVLLFLGLAVCLVVSRIVAERASRR